MKSKYYNVAYFKTTSTVRNYKTYEKKLTQTPNVKRKQMQ